MNNRLKQFLAAENISQSQFADTIKVVRASVSHVLSGRNKPGYDFITAIMAAYPHLNMEWLMLGRGKMYKQEQMTQPSSDSRLSSDDLPLLFDYQDDLPADDFRPQISQTYANPPDEVYTPARNSIETSNNNIQIAVKQRKATKIVIFYDDDTFQEIVSNTL